MDKRQAIREDGGGFESLTQAVRDILNEYGEIIDREIMYDETNAESGIAFYTREGAQVLSEREDVLGGYYQECRYNCYVIYKLASVNEWQKLSADQFVDTLGKWICGEDVEINGQTLSLSHFPILSGERKIKRITRDNYFAQQPGDDGVQNWVLPISVEYTNTIPPKW